MQKLGREAVVQLTYLEWTARHEYVVAVRATSTGATVRSVTGIATLAVATFIPLALDFTVQALAVTERGCASPRALSESG